MAANTNYNFTFGGVSNTEMGIVVADIIRPLLPSIKTAQVAIPGRMGVYDFGVAELEQKIIEVDCWIDDEAVPQTLRNIAKWLYTNTYKQLIFNDEPDKFYLAKLYSKVDARPVGRMEQFTLQFVAQPLAYSTIQDTKVDTFSGDATIAITNGGTFEAVPVIKMVATEQSINPHIIHPYGEFKWMSTLQVGQELKIDCDLMALEVNNVNRMLYQVGQFPVIPSGTSNFTFANFRGTLEIKYTKRWL